MSDNMNRGLVMRTRRSVEAGRVVWPYLVRDRLPGRKFVTFVELMETGAMVVDEHGDQFLVSLANCRTGFSRPRFAPKPEDGQ